MIDYLLAERRSWAVRGLIPLSAIAPRSLSDSLPCSETSRSVCALALVGTLIGASRGRDALASHI